MKKANLLQAKARERFGFFSSLVIHFILFIVLSLSGVFMQQHHASDVTEVMFFSGGGGGGGGGGQETDVEVEEAAALEKEAASLTGDEISYAESRRELAAERPRKATPKPAAMPKEGAAAKVKGGSGTGTGGGHGSGHGTGTGSGTGPGSGSGSGGGHGSGHGTGIGSGVGPGSGIVRQPAVPPRVVYSVSPVYPEYQRQANIDGVSVLRLLIGTDGKVEEVTLMKSSGSSALDNSAIRACRQWRFTSAKNGSGQKVRCYWDIPIRFRLDR